MTYTHTLLYFNRYLYQYHYLYLYPYQASHMEKQAMKGSAGARCQISFAVDFNHMRYPPTLPGRRPLQ